MSICPPVHRIGSNSGIQLTKRGPTVIGIDPEEDPREYVLYRLLTQEMDLLYVGITMNVFGRFRKHREDKHWWDLVQVVLLERHPSRESVLLAERKAIALEKPTYNIVHNSGNDGESTEFGSTPCPVCRKVSFYRALEDRHFHQDGSDNIDCWVELTKGTIDAGLIDQFGRPYKESTLPPILYERSNAQTSHL